MRRFFQDERRRERRREQKATSRRRKEDKRQKAANRVRRYIGYCDGASFGGMMMMGMMMGTLFSRSVDVHVDKCLHFCRGVPKLCGLRSSVYRHAVKGILITISSVLAVSN